MSANSVIAGMMVVLSAATASIDTAIENAIPVTQTVTGVASKDANHSSTPKTRVTHTTTITPEEGQEGHEEHSAGGGEVQETINEDTPMAPGSIPGVSLEEERMFDKLAECESGGDWHIDTNPLYKGGLQHSDESWIAAGGGQFAPQAHLATREEQIRTAKKLKDMQGWGAWPTCSARYGFI